MTFRAVDVYELLEPLLKDFGKLRLRNMCEMPCNLFTDVPYDCSQPVIH